MNQKFISCLESLTSLSCNQATILSTLIQIQSTIDKNSNAIKYLTAAINPKKLFKETRSNAKPTELSVRPKVVDFEIQTDILPSEHPILPKENI